MARRREGLSRRGVLGETASLVIGILVFCEERRAPQASRVGRVECCRWTGRPTMTRPCDLSTPRLAPAAAVRGMSESCASRSLCLVPHNLCTAPPCSRQRPRERRTASDSADHSSRTLKVASVTAAAARAIGLRPPPPPPPLSLAHNLESLRSFGRGFPVEVEGDRVSNTLNTTHIFNFTSINLPIYRHYLTTLTTSSKTSHSLGTQPTSQLKYTCYTIWPVQNCSSTLSCSISINAKHISLDPV